MDIERQEERVNSQKKVSRRRKKRRTDVSSDSDSDSNPSSSDDQSGQETSQTVGTSDTLSHLNGVNDLIGGDHQEKIRGLNNKHEVEELDAAIQARLRQVPFKSQEPILVDKPQTSTENLVNKHNKDREELDSQFLQLMTEQFGDQLDKLRKDPNFSNRSLMVLAQMLESSNNLFDDDEIKNLLAKNNVN